LQQFTSAMLNLDTSLFRALITNTRNYLHDAWDRLDTRKYAQHEPITGGDHGWRIAVSRR
jgi:hypothetical protein